MGLCRRSAAVLGLLTAMATSLLIPLVQASTTPVSITPNLNANDAGSSLSQILMPSYAGMGIEPSNLLAFTGTDVPNPLTYQLLDNLKNFTGVPSHIRIGGNTGDNMLFSSASNSFSLESNESSRSSATAAKWYYGNKFFNAMDHLPAKTPITYGLNLVYDGPDAIERIVEQASAALDNLKNVVIAGFEVGNEPDLYVQNQYRPSGWSAPEYGQEWLERVQAIHSQVLAPRNRTSNFFEVAVTATTANKNGHPFRISNLVQDTDGVAAQNGVYVAGFNQHDYLYYIGVSNFPMTLDWLLDMANTRQQFSEWQNQAAQAKKVGKPYYLREMGSIGPEGIQGISDTFANTLWTFNFFLYAATVQVSSVQMHMTQTSYSAPWQPIPAQGEPAHVRSSYYAYAAIAQVIGAQCNTRVASVDLGNIPGNYNGRLNVYSIYTDDNLTGLALLNTQTSNASNPTGNDVSFTFTAPKLAGKTFYLSSLAAAGTDSTQNTTWNGMSFEMTADGLPRPADNSSIDTVKVDSSGKVSIRVPDGTAVVANLDEQLGSNSNVDEGKCKVLSTSGEGPDASPSGPGGDPPPTFSPMGKLDTNSGLSTGGIVAIAVAVPCGVIALLTALALTIFFLCRRRRRRDAAAAAGGGIAGKKADLTDSLQYGSRSYLPTTVHDRAPSDSQDSAMYAPATHPVY